MSRFYSIWPEMYLKSLKVFLILILIFRITPGFVVGQGYNPDWERHFNRHAAAQSFPADYTQFRVTSAHQSNISKISHVYLRQIWNDIDIVDGSLSLHVDKHGKLLKMNDRFIQNLSAKIEPAPTITAIESIIENVWDSLGVQEVGEWKVVQKQEIPSLFTEIEVEKTIYGNVVASLAYVLNERGNLSLCWEIRFETSDGKHAWVVFADVSNGKLCKAFNQVLECAFEADARDKNLKPFLPFNVQSINPQYAYNVFPEFVESPNHGPRNLRLNASDPDASPYNWHDTDGLPGAEYTTTKGNNVDAREDKDGNNSTPGEMAEGGESLVFDFPLLPGVHPHTNQNASITNLFYWNNIIHDIFYQYGFDEPAGNFQTNNYGNGGLANDHVNAQAMDGGGLNNANFFTPVDGQQPRMQMYLWNGSKSLTINQPFSLQGNYGFEKAGFGPVTFNVSGNVVLVNDGSSSPSLGCDSLINGAEIDGNIALVDRGTCEFSLKCLRAQNAGAVAVIVCNNVTGNPIVMSTGTYGSGITIPSVMMSKQNCDSIKLYLNSGVNITMIVGNPVDGDYDNGIITHEYGHGISIRLTGGAGVNNCLNNQEQMGEGWSDWFGLMLTMEEDDTEQRARGIGTYALLQPTTGQGIRPYRYSTDLNINPHTYNSIITAAVPHGVGAVWCAMLWEVTWALIREYGYDTDLYNGTGGNNKALAIVTEALKLQPCSPGFVDGRDAILLADSILYGGANSCLIWKAFAKRGLGYSASQGSSTSKTDGIQAFDMPASCCKYVSNTSDSGNGSLRAAIQCASPGETIRFLNFIKHDTIGLTTSGLSVTMDLTITKPSAWNLVIESKGDFPVIENTEALILENICMKAGSGTGVRGIYNTGNLYLKSVQLVDPLYGSGQGQTIQNEGDVLVEGNTVIKTN